MTDTADLMEGLRASYNAVVGGSCVLLAGRLAPARGNWRRAANVTAFVLVGFGVGGLAIDVGELLGRRAVTDLGVVWTMLVATGLLVIIATISRGAAVLYLMAAALGLFTAFGIVLTVGELVAEVFHAAPAGEPSRMAPLGPGLILTVAATLVLGVPAAASALAGVLRDGRRLPAAGPGT